MFGSRKLAWREMGHWGVSVKALGWNELFGRDYKISPLLLLSSPHLLHVVKLWCPCCFCFSVLVLLWFSIFLCLQLPSTSLSSGIYPSPIPFDLLWFKSWHRCLIYYTTKHLSLSLTHTLFERDPSSSSLSLSHAHFERDPSPSSEGEKEFSLTTRKQIWAVCKVGCRIWNDTK